MAETFQLTREKSGCVFKIQGLIGKEEMRRLALRQTGDDMEDTGDYMIVDLLDADYSQISERDISMVITHTFESTFEHRDMKLAIVATDPQVVRMTEYYLSVMEKMDREWAPRMFETLGEARAWVEG